MDNLNAGDFLYQSDQELFLVVAKEKDDSYLFAAHGWRDIDKSRIDHYIEDSQSKVHKQDEIEDLIDERGDDDDMEKFNELKELFEIYEDLDVPDDGVADEFALDEK